MTIRCCLFRRTAALLLALFFAVTLCLSCFADHPMPIQTAKEDESVLLFDPESGRSILQQNSEKSRYIASLTKIMTGLLLLESGIDLEQTVTVPAVLSKELENIRKENGSNMNLKTGENIRLIDLLYGLLIASANDAASVIAYNLGSGSVDAFVERMNARAIELGCTSTHFSSPHGLYNENNVSTAHDLAILAAECYSNETFMQVASTASYTLPANNKHSEPRVILSTNPMIDTSSNLYRSYIHGMKTGFTMAAGRCFITFGEQDGHAFGLVILGCTSSKTTIYTEAAMLMDWVFANYSTRVLVETERAIADVPLAKSKQNEKIPVYVEHEVTGYGHPDDLVSYIPNIPSPLRATLKEGSIVGTVTIYLDGREVETVNLVTHDTYLSDFRTAWNDLVLLLPILLALVALLSGVTIFLSHKATSAKNSQKRKPQKHINA